MSTLFDDLSLPAPRPEPDRRGPGGAADPESLVADLNPPQRAAVEHRGGPLLIEWAGNGAPVRMTGPATTVFEGEIQL